MDGRRAGSCVMFGSAPSSPSFSVSLLVKLSVAGRGRAGKGGSRMLIPDRVVMAKVGASGFGVSLLLIVESIWEYCSRSSLQWLSSPFSLRLMFPHGEIQALLMGSSSPCLNRRIKSLRVEVRLTGKKWSRNRDTLSRHFAAFPLREKWKNLNLDVSLVALSAYVARVNDSSGLFGWNGDRISETRGCGARMFMQGLGRGWRFRFGVVVRRCFIVKEVSSSNSKRVVLMRSQSSSPKPSKFSFGFVERFR
ncbi:hypothetical protein Tco_0570290 [Tanacetum coccineum]